MPSFYVRGVAPGWRDSLRDFGNCIHGLPCRPGGHLPEINKSNGKFGIRDYPRPEISYIHDTREQALAVAMAFFSKTKYTKEAFMRLLSKEHMAAILGAYSPDDALIELAQRHYFCVYEGIPGWPYTPHSGGVDADGLSFRDHWDMLETRISNVLLYGPSRAVDDVPRSDEVVAVPGGEDSLPVIKPMEHSKVLLLL